MCEKLIATIESLIDLIEDITDYYVPDNHPDHDISADEIRRAKEVIEESRDEK